MYGRQEARAALSKRPHAVEKAMQMKIKNVPWWNKRSRLERRLMLVTLSLVLLISILITAIVLTVRSYSDVSRTINKYLNDPELLRLAV